MARSELGFCRATTVAVTMMCLGLGGHAWAKDAPTTPEGCAAVAKQAASQCKVEKKKAKDACKAGAADDKDSCVQRKKDCVAAAKAAKRKAKNRKHIGVKCSVKNRQCTTEAAAEKKRCELQVKGDALKCDLAQQADKAICLATAAQPARNIEARCEAQCGAQGDASSQVCKGYQSHEEKICKLTKKLAIKDCKLGKKVCVDENRVAKLLRKAGKEGTKKDCSKRVKACTRAAKDALKSCEQTIADNTCAPEGVVPCTVKCVQTARALPPPRGKLTSVAKSPDSVDEPRSASDIPVKPGKGKIPYPVVCSRDAIEVYTDVVTEIFTVMIKHHEDVEAAVRAIDAYENGHPDEVACVREAVVLWQAMPEAKQELLRTELTQMRGMVRSLTTSAPKLLKDARIRQALSFK